ncbi:MAG: M15 family metallopeptidase [Clostridiales bacterium]|jgi:D-alanyl-D-alanine carboxypeptidase|nr:M15 family metallopeptidase [Clostridiales bacterium]
MYKRKILPMVIIVLITMFFITSCDIIGGKQPTASPTPQATEDPVDVFEKDNIKVSSVTQDNMLNFGNISLKDVELKADDYKQGIMVLINSDNPLPDGYILEPMVTLFSIRPTNLYSLKDAQVALKKEAADNINDMFYASTAADAGKYNIYSAYRTVEYQQELLDREVARLVDDENKSEEDALATALLTIAKPGYSEHNSGLAMDVGTVDVNGKLLYGEDINGTTQAAWIKDNSWLFGFIIRYPLEKASITKISYEPWHLRFVGKPNAAAIYTMNMCLEEYLEYMESKGCISVEKDGSEYCRIFYYPKETSSVKIPQGYDYDISGTGNGYIVTVYVNK